MSVAVDVAVAVAVDVAVGVAVAVAGRQWLVGSLDQPFHPGLSTVF
jgi:hypothetical protein